MSLARNLVVLVGVAVAVLPVNVWCPQTPGVAMHRCCDLRVVLPHEVTGGSPGGAQLLAHGEAHIKHIMHTGSLRAACQVHCRPGRPWTVSLGDAVPRADIGGVLQPATPLLALPLQLLLQVLDADLS